MEREQRVELLEPTGQAEIERAPTSLFPRSRAGEVMRMRRALAISALVALVLLVAAGPAAAAPSRARAGPQAGVDFNGDGFADLAVGAPGEGIGNVQGAGALNVFFGSSTGLQAAGDVLFQGSQPAQGGPVAGTAETSDGFGAAVAKGLFNDDDFFDVAVGVPGEAVGSDSEAGAVIVLFGSPGGITTAGHQTLVQGSGISGRPRPATSSAMRWPPGCWPATTSPTWSSGRPARTSAPRPTPARSTCSPARRAAWSTARSRPRASPRAATASGRR
jgi:hypothetical protein